MSLFQYQGACPTKIKPSKANKLGLCCYYLKVSCEMPESEITYALYRNIVRLSPKETVETVLICPKN